METQTEEEIRRALFGTDDEDDENDEDVEDVNHDTVEQEVDQDQAVGDDVGGEPDAATSRSRS